MSVFQERGDPPLLVLRKQLHHTQINSSDLASGRWSSQLFDCNISPLGGAQHPLLSPEAHPILSSTDLSWETSHQTDNPGQILDILDLQRNLPSISKYLY